MNNLGVFNFMQPKISIIIVVLNGMGTFERALRSIWGQTYQHIELIIIDGGSVDGTLELIQQHKHHIAYWHSRKDKGIYDAMNEALTHCTGDWCLFLGCDDVLFDCLEQMIPFFEDPKSVYYGRVIRRSLGKPSPGPFSRLKLTYTNICHQAIFYPKHIYSTKKYDVYYRLLADYKYNIELWGCGVRFVFLDFLVADYNDCGSASTGDASFVKDKDMLLKQNFGRGYAWLWWLREQTAVLYRKLKRAYH